MEFGDRCNFGDGFAVNAQAAGAIFSHFTWTELRVDPLTVSPAVHTDAVCYTEATSGNGSLSLSAARSADFDSTDPPALWPGSGSSAG